MKYLLELLARGFVAELWKDGRQFCCALSMGDDVTTFNGYGGSPRKCLQDAVDNYDDATASYVEEVSA